ncbi:TAXI family TRAP transporter solute-binding subunit [Gelria sp. Kuro-4]|uniref:TAXI family TRAP transporter solute-binding subunit n=1 Tax=Gelria sp. Kuro-4 TaxID=2796927 RepID=UPI001BEE3FD9|nr:TAXI family TRAP transporter solute-binding subunit [Gelria sp. Kuro-4]BCV26052.1 C4-dicarboxylate ABC transporter substrate-binding protein [Gelria sp. Kuro-4]
MTMKWKKYALRITALALVVVVALTAAGCGKGQSTQSESGSDQAVETTYVTIGGGSTGGAMFIIAAGMANLAEKYIPGLKATSEMTTASVENARRVGRNELTFGLCTIDVALSALNGNREFASEGKYTDLRFVMRGYTTLFEAVVNENSSIKSIADLKGKKVAVLAGVTAESWWPSIAEAYGLTPGSYSSTILSNAECMDALRDGVVDAAITWSGLPTTAITDLATTKNIRFLPVEPDKAEVIIKDHPYFAQAVIPANTYKNQTEDVPSLSVAIILVTNNNVKEDVVYNFTKTLLEHQEELAAVHPMAGEFNKENAVKDCLIPMHPGAEKYYRKIGLVK